MLARPGLDLIWSSVVGDDGIGPDLERPRRSRDPVAPVAERVKEPEFTSITVRASVGSMITYPPEGRSTRGLRASRIAAFTR
jgi:hypothetical protein